MGENCVAKSLQKFNFFIFLHTKKIQEKERVEKGGGESNCKLSVDITENLHTPSPRGSLKRHILF